MQKLIKEGGTMQYTNNFGLKMPEDTDKVNQEDFNYNSKIIDKKLIQAQQTLELVDILIKGSKVVDEGGNYLVDENGNYIVS
jgi:hypothetical protein